MVLVCRLVIPDGEGFLEVVRVRYEVPFWDQFAATGIVAVSVSLIGGAGLMSKTY